MSAGSSPWYVAVTPEWLADQTGDGRCGSLPIFDSRKQAEDASPKRAEIRTMAVDPVGGGGGGGGGGSVLYILSDPL